MKTDSFDIDGPLLITPDVYKDDRGDFLETFSERAFIEVGVKSTFVQDNQSRSLKNVLRGLHFQNSPYAQGKLVRVSKGAVLDVIVDFRLDSPTLGRHLKVVLDDIKCQLLWVPPGFAHGFLALEDDTVFNYKCTGYYHKESESGIIWNDPDLAIEWGIKDPIVSSKDQSLPSYRQVS